MALALGALAGAGWARAADAPARWTQVWIGDSVIAAEVAETPAERALGLGGRDALAADAGMLFVFPAADRHAFWMKDMRFDLDFVWLREGRIVDLTPGVRAGLAAPLTILRPAEPADRVLEVAAGTAARHGWQPGDRVRIRGPGSWSAAPAR